MGDIGGNLAEGNETYKLESRPMSVLLKEHETLASKFTLENTESVANNKELPLLFATPKLHKNPFGWRLPIPHLMPCPVTILV